jgi:hypothetical protein
MASGKTSGRLDACASIRLQTALASRTYVLLAALQAARSASDGAGSGVGGPKRVSIVPARQRDEASTAPSSPICASRESRSQKRGSPLPPCRWRRKTRDRSRLSRRRAPLREDPPPGRTRLLANQRHSRQGPQQHGRRANHDQCRAGISVDSGSASGDTTMCLEISGNTTGGSTNTATSRRHRD